MKKVINPALLMQPLTMTKPTVECTGLGLSIAYDLVVKTHGATIQINSIERNGSEFIRQMPVK